VGHPAPGNLVAAPGPRFHALGQGCNGCRRKFARPVALPYLRSWVLTLARRVVSRLQSCHVPRMLGRPPSVSSDPAASATVQRLHHASRVTRWLWARTLRTWTALLQALRLGSSPVRINRSSELSSAIIGAIRRSSTATRKHSRLLAVGSWILNALLRMAKRLSAPGAGPKLTSV
jgi:hypothetical protein